MKTNKTLKKIVLILIILVVSFISLCGIFIKNTNRYENKIPEYNYGMQFAGSRVIDLQVDLTEEETTIETEENENQEAETTNEEEEQEPETELVPVNPPETLTPDNYKKSKKILEARLKALGVQEYIIRQNSGNGNITIEIPENSQTDDIIGVLNTTGKFEMTDAETGEILLDNSHIKSSQVLYNTETNGTTIYLGISFNKEGKQKLKEISEKYVKTEDEEGNDTTKNVTMRIDEQEIVSTYFGSTIENGEITLPMQEGITDVETMQEYLQSTGNVAAVIDNGNIPIVYTLEDNRYVLTEENNTMNLIKIISVGIGILGIIYFIIAYKKKGILASFLELGFVSVLLLLERYTNVIITMEGVFASFFISIIAYLYLIKLLKELKNKQVEELKPIFYKNLKNTILNLLPLFVIAIVFALQPVSSVNSFGMVIFWGIAIFFAYLVWFAKWIFVDLECKGGIKAK